MEVFQQAFGQLWSKHQNLIVDGVIGVIIITFFTFVGLSIIQRSIPKKLPRWFKVLAPLPVGALFYIIIDWKLNPESILKGFILGCITSTFYDVVVKHLVDFIQSKFFIPKSDKKKT
jgi:hypothetical protein